MNELLEFTRALDFTHAAVFSLITNLIVFVLALIGGALVTSWWKQRRVALVAPPLSRSELVLAAACVVLNSVVMLVGWALFHGGFLEINGTNSIARWLLDALLLVLVMDLAMYVTHRIAHHPIAFRFVHGIHHRYDSPRPLTLFVLHPIEVLGFGGLWIAVLCTHLYAFSLGGMLIYLTINTTFGLLGHVGVEPLPSRWVKWPLLKLIGTSTFHARHHQTPTANYGFYTSIWDNVFRTLDPSYVPRFALSPQSSVLSGQDEHTDHPTHVAPQAPARSKAPHV